MCPLLDKVIGGVAVTFLISNGSLVLPQVHLLGLDSSDEEEEEM